MRRISVDLAKKVAVVVGGGSGMGRATAEAFARQGATLAIVDLPGGKGAAAAEDLDASFHPCDVTDETGSEEALAAVVERHGGLHIAVNTAGGGVSKRTISRDGPLPMADFRRIIELNLMATFNLNRLQAWHMSKNEPTEDGERGVIINTSSIAAFEGQIGQVAYSAAKAGIAGMSLTMARDLGGARHPGDDDRAEPVRDGPARRCLRRDHRHPHQGRRVPQAGRATPGIRLARRGDREEPDAQRPDHQARRGPAVRTPLTTPALPRSRYQGASHDAVGGIHRPRGRAGGGRAHLHPASRRPRRAGHQGGDRSGGDFARDYDDLVRGMAAHFVWANRNKESIALDLKHPRGREVLGELVAIADVLVQNLAPGAAARLGLDADDLRARHPRLITVDISGMAGMARCGPHAPTTCSSSRRPGRAPSPAGRTRRPSQVSR
jgi:NAD(P)-dependent dehydrogenase (short-subunit alcohol dehydrogenase family)